MIYTPTKHEDYDKWVFLSAPLTSTSWDGDTKTDADRYIIDLSAVFGTPPNIKAIYGRLSGQGTSGYIRIGPDSTFNYALICHPIWGATIWQDAMGITPCDSNGDVYCYVSAGATITGVYFNILAYLL